MKTTAIIENGHLVSTIDLRSLLNGEGRETLVNALSARVELSLARTRNGLSVCVTDGQSGTVMVVALLESLLADSLEQGTLVENTLDRLPEDEALGRTREFLLSLVDRVTRKIDLIGTPEEDFDDQPLPARAASVEADATMAPELVS